MALLAILSLSVVCGAPLTLVGSHPTSVQTGFREIHSLKQFDGRIYMAYGNYDQYPAVVLVSYDIAANQFILEHSAGTDSTGYFREIDGKLYSTSIDPIHYEDFQDFCYLDPVHGWRDRTPIGFFHCYDVAKVGSTMFASGSRHDHERPGSGQPAVLMLSEDNGATWTDAYHNSNNRFYWCFGYQGRLYVEDGYYEDGSFTPSSTFSGTYDHLYKPTEVDGEEGSIIVALADRNVGSDFRNSTELKSFDGTVRTLRNLVVDFTWDGQSVYVLSSWDLKIYRTESLTAEAADWIELPISSVPSAATSIEVAGELVFIGDKNGKLWCARLDGEPHSVDSPEVINQLPDSYGRGLAIDGGTLIVGAPDTETLVPLAGAAEVFEETGAGPGPAERLQSTAELLPPLPDFSGWFGKDVAVFGDLLAVVETGRDTSNADRGSSAKVYVYQKIPGAQGYREVYDRSIPFAHNVAISSEYIAVATAKPAANQAAGTPAIALYRIIRNGDDVSFSYHAELRTNVGGWGYKPSTRLVISEDLIVAGFSGDVSRDGGEGMVAIFSKNPNTSNFISTSNVITSSRPERFGFALSMDGLWLAVGAPRDDRGLPQSGSVYLYERPVDSPTFTLSQTLTSPNQQEEGLFGSSVAIKNGHLVVGSPGEERADVPRAGNVYRFAFDEQSGTWLPAGELTRPINSIAEFGIEVAIGDSFIAAGSRVSLPSSVLSERVAIEAVDLTPPESQLTQWLATHSIDAAELFSDGDGDRFSNFDEFVFNMDPHQADVEAASIPPGGESPSGVPFIRKEPGDGSYHFCWVARTTDPSLVVTVEQSTDFQTWELDGRVPTETGGGDFRHHELPADLGLGDTRMFYRLRFSYPEEP